MRRSRILIPLLLLFFQAEVIQSQNHQKELVRDQPVTSELLKKHISQTILVYQKKGRMESEQINNITKQFQVLCENLSVEEMNWKSNRDNGSVVDLIGKAFLKSVQPEKKRIPTFSIWKPETNTTRNMVYRLGTAFDTITAHEQRQFEQVGKVVFNPDSEPNVPPIHKTLNFYTHDENT